MAFNIEALVKTMQQCTITKNSMIARIGNKAETMFCKSPKVSKALSDYFEMNVVRCEKIGSRKKSDVLITFEDGSQTRLQLKNGKGGGRGWSFDRRHVNELPTNDLVKDQLKTVCLKHDGQRSNVPMDKELIKMLFTGDDITQKPSYVAHVILENDDIASLSICSMTLFLETLISESYQNCVLKRTCVHLTPCIYLQRKGGGKKDHSPDDIQAKLRSMPNCMTDLKLC
jgi:hypothetical protein